MTKDDFVNAATPLIRQGVTLTAGLLAAKGMTNAGNSLEVWAMSGSLFGASIIWALAEKSKLLGSIIDEAPASDLDAALGVVQQFRAQGVSPVLVAHMAQVASSLAVAELNAAAPLASTPAVQAPPADAAVPPPPASPGVIAQADPAFVTLPPEPAATVGAAAAGAFTQQVQP
jgi:hypothetical protein